MDGYWEKAEYIDFINDKRKSWLWHRLMLNDEIFFLFKKNFKEYYFLYNWDEHSWFEYNILVYDKILWELYYFNWEEIEIAEMPLKTYSWNDEYFSIHDAIEEEKILQLFDKKNWESYLLKFKKDWTVLIKYNWKFIELNEYIKNIFDNEETTQGRKTNLWNAFKDFKSLYSWKIIFINDKNNKKIIKNNYDNIISWEKDETDQYKIYWIYAWKNKYINVYNIKKKKFIRNE